MSDETRAQLEVLDREWSGRKAVLYGRVGELARESHYGEAAALVDAHLVAWLEVFTPARRARLKAEQLFVYPSEDDFRGLAANLRRRGELWTRASQDYGVAQRLLLELVERKPFGFALEALPLTHPQVQSLFDAVREQHEGTSRLFSGRAVRLVLECDSFQADFHRAFAQALATSLGPLGIRASTDHGEERLVVKGVLDGPHSAHYIGDDVCMGSLDVSAIWDGSGLTAFSFSESVVGSEEDDDFADRLQAATAKTFPLELLKAWAATDAFRP